MNIKDIIKLSQNEYANVAEDAICGEIKGWVDSGSYTLNALLSGSIFKGFPSNKIVGFIGVESTGKTFYTLAACKNFLEMNPTGVVVYFESENALTKEILSGRGIALNRFVHLPVTTVQEFKTQALRIVDEKLSDKEDLPMLFVLDSLGNLSTNKEMEDSAAGSDTKDMTRAQIIKAAFRVLALKLGMANIPMIFTNHVYDKIGAGPYAGKEQGGGSGSKYAASITISLTKAKEKDGDEVIGSIISCTAVKSRLVREQMKVKTLIRFSGGLDRYYGLIDLAEKSGAFKKVSTKYEMPDGKKYFEKAIERNPEKFFTTDILDIIENYVQKNFKYGVASVENEIETIEEENDE